MGRIVGVAQLCAWLDEEMASIYSPETPPSAHLHLAPPVGWLPLQTLPASLALLIRLLAALIQRLLRLPAPLLLLRRALLLLLCPSRPLLPRPCHPTPLSLLRRLRRLLLRRRRRRLLHCSASTLLPRLIGQLRGFGLQGEGRHRLAGVQSYS